MLGPEAVTARLRSRRERDAAASWVEERETAADTVCELCDSEGVTTEEYGLDVCPLCAERLLP